MLPCGDGTTLMLSLLKYCAYKMLPKNGLLHNKIIQENIKLCLPEFVTFDAPNA